MGTNILHNFYVRFNNNTYPCPYLQSHIEIIYTFYVHFKQSTLVKRAYDAYFDLYRTGLDRGHFSSYTLNGIELFVILFKNVYSYPGHMVHNITYPSRFKTLHSNRCRNNKKGKEGKHFLYRLQRCTRATPHIYSLTPICLFTEA